MPSRQILLLKVRYLIVKDLPTPSAHTERKGKRFSLSLSLGVGYLVCIHTFLPSEIAFTFTPMCPGAISPFGAFAFVRCGWTLTFCSSQIDDAKLI